MAALQTSRRRAVSALATVIGIGACALSPSAALASEKISDNASNVRIKVDDRGHAVIYYTRAGRRWHPVVWGAVNARHPHPSIPQVKFKVDYSGGHMKLGRPLWRTIRNRCRPYDGPPLPWFVAGCKAPDGSYWALQRFQRLAPNLGLSPWRPFQRAWELHLSHWTGETARLEVYADWVMSDRAHELFGRLSYRGRPVHGFRATRGGAPLDGYGRLIYLDVRDSVYGPGWKRENSFLARRPNGHFCYGFWARPRYAGYPAGAARGPANGSSYRLTAGGPGVTPFVMATVNGLPGYDPNNPRLVQHENEMNAVKAQLIPADAACAGN